MHILPQNIRSWWYVFPLSCCECYKNLKLNRVFGTINVEGKERKKELNKVENLSLFAFSPTSANLFPSKMEETVIISLDYVYLPSEEVSVKSVQSWKWENFRKRKVFNGKFCRCLIEKHFCGSVEKSKDVFVQTIPHPHGTKRCSRKTINHTELKNWKLFKYLAKANERFSVPVRMPDCWCLHRR